MKKIICVLVCILALSSCQPSVESRMKKVGSTSDQTVLAKMAIEYSDEGVCKAAVQKLTDQSAD